jgi:hypothetical protein
MVAVVFLCRGYSWSILQMLCIESALSKVTHDSARSCSIEKALVKICINQIDLHIYSTPSNICSPHPSPSPFTLGRSLLLVTRRINLYATI